MTEKNTLTTAAGIPVGDNQNALTAGPRGPLLVQDWQLFEKHAHFNRERIPTAMWDFWSLSPESLHQVTILFSDRGLPKNYRQMNGYGSHTYSLINA